MVIIFSIKEPYINSSDTQKGRQHCVLKKSFTNFSPYHIYDPKPKVELIDGQNKYGLNIEPSEVKISSRAGLGEFEIWVSPEAPKKTNLNIYFLVHLSIDLEDILAMIKNNLDEIGMKGFGMLVKDLIGSFPNMMIGIGKFADIPIFPFVKLLSKDSKTDYVFQNLQSLTKDMSKVKVLVNMRKKYLSGEQNQALDEPESVLDAMAQASECSQIVFVLVHLDWMGNG
ncbi:hypothetical protein RF11_13652 [Thelohanellus kitauei]|uniref:Integrin beta subunit VWA domain-containing protein n=1 Tax=Thelohanellus kitauei TaxID=669202 RepID=A0A0C2N5Y4_THEKT|nr:hypothetical protein RF11_13652 [Thelohanellus kitauei]